MRIESGITEFRGEVSAEAAGVIATLFVLSHLSIQYESDHLAEGYHRLHDYLHGHPEASAIFQAIDWMETSVPSSRRGAFFMPATAAIRE